MIARQEVQKEPIDEFDDEGKIRWAQEDFPRDMFKDFSEEWVGEEA